MHIFQMFSTLEYLQTYEKKNEEEDYFLYFMNKVELMRIERNRRKGYFLYFMDRLEMLTINLN